MPEPSEGSPAGGPSIADPGAPTRTSQLRRLLHGSHVPGLSGPALFSLSMLKQRDENNRNEILFFTEDFKVADS